MGTNGHEHLCDSLELFADEIIFAFQKRDREHVAEKQTEVEPAIEDAMKRKEWPKAPAELDPSTVEPYERPDDRYE